jgi:hypothetical protein
MDLSELPRSLVDCIQINLSACKGTDLSISYKVIDQTWGTPRTANMYCFWNATQGKHDLFTLSEIAHSLNFSINELRELVRDIPKNIIINRF